jgi:hypothetical protein
MDEFTALDYIRIGGVTRFALWERRMKVYLSEYSHGKDSYWSKNEAEKLKSKPSKSNLKGKM